MEKVKVESVGVDRVTVVGCGPAGAMAALAALREGSPVTVYEKTRFPRHKVCGEFLSPEFVAVAERLGVWGRIRDAGAVPIQRMSLRIGRRVLRHKLSEPAHGLSRHRLDDVLLSSTAREGAVVVREKAVTPPPGAVWAVGRKTVEHGRKDERLFGFKAHFAGPQLDSVELHFFDGCYVGVSPIEDGKTNVCGLGPLRVLRRHKFEPDELLRLSPALGERVAPLRRDGPWLKTGPLVYGEAPESSLPADVYPAGDARAFVDPFTGAGMTIAAITGSMAGLAASRGVPPNRFRRRSDRVLRRTLRAAGFLRLLLAAGWAEPLSRMASASLLFRATRPRLMSD